MIEQGAIHHSDNLQDFLSRYQPDLQLSSRMHRPIDDLYSSDKRFLSLLEVGCIAGAFPSPIPDEVRELIKSIGQRISLDAIGNERLLLIALALNRAETSSGFVSTVTPIENFFYILDLTDSLVNNRNIGSWLSLLIDSQRRPDVFEAFKEQLRDVEPVSSVIADADFSGQFSSEIRGLLDTVEYLARITDLLRDADECRVTRSAIWHYYMPILTVLSDEIESFYECLLELGATELRQGYPSTEEEEQKYIRLSTEFDRVFDMVLDIISGREYSEPVVDEWRDRGAPGAVGQLARLSHKSSQGSFQQYFNLYRVRRWSFRSNVERHGREVFFKRSMTAPRFSVKASLERTMQRISDEAYESYLKERGLTRTEYTSMELLAVAAAREVPDGAFVFAGTGLPLLASMLAQYTMAPHSTLIMEAGIVGPQLEHLPISASDPRGCLKASMVSNMADTFGTTALRGDCTIGILGGAECDKYGNINSTVIGGYWPAGVSESGHGPHVRFAGSAGANNIASFADKVLVVMVQEERRFPEHVEYITSPAGWRGPRNKKESRWDYGLGRGESW